MLPCYYHTNEGGQVDMSCIITPLEYAVDRLIDFSENNYNARNRTMQIGLLQSLNDVFYTEIADRTMRIICVQCSLITKDQSWALQDCIVICCESISMDIICGSLTGGQSQIRHS